MVLDSLFPVFTLLVLGRALRHFDLTGDAFLRTSDRLIYFIFFPVLLFWKIGGASGGGVDGAFFAAVVLAVLVIYLLSLLFIRHGRVGRYQAGTFSQSCYRFNTYIGMAVVINACGQEGVRHFGLLIGLIIPLINLLAVPTLIWFSRMQCPPDRRLRLTLRALVANPLIVACLAGMAYARLVGGFLPFVDNALALISMVTLPLALLSIGGGLTPAAVRGHFRLAAVAAGFKLVLLPVVGFVLLEAFAVEPPLFRVAMIFFCLPASTAIYVLSGQLDSDTGLAAAAIVLSTLLSFGALSVVLLP